MIRIYIRLLNTNIQSITDIINKVFPENISSLIEHGTVLISEGNSFECSVEPHAVNGFYLSSQFKASLVAFNDVLLLIINQFEKSKILYDIDYELEENNKYIEYNIKHPDFDNKDFIRIN